MPTHELARYREEFQIAIKDGNLPRGIELAAFAALVAEDKKEKEIWQKRLDALRAGRVLKFSTATLESIE